MTTAVPSVSPVRKTEPGNQEMLLAGIVTLTETTSPVVAVLASALTPLTRTVGALAPLTPAVVREELTALVIALVSEPARAPTRAPLRAALLSNSITIMARPNSMMPRISVNNRGAMMANSTAAVAHLLPLVFFLVFPPLEETAAASGFGRYLVANIGVSSPS